MMRSLSVNSHGLAACCLLLLATGIHMSLAVLERVGPTSTLPSQGGFPVWYQDTTGLVLEFCDPKTPEEVAAPYCLLTTADVSTLPEAFPGNFYDEHFYFAADASMTTAQGERALLVLALEAAFAANVLPGEQIMFTRIRVRLDSVPVSGTYRFIHPYGEEVIEGTAGDRIFFTDDVGINCKPGDFSCAMTGRLGPFLLPSTTRGGAEKAPFTGPGGQLYIAEPGVDTFVTGSPTENNFFRIEGPPGCNLGGAGIDFIETDQFSLMGRIYRGAIPGRVDFKRSEYLRTATDSQLDIFVAAQPTTQGRLPAQPTRSKVMPTLSVYPAPCTVTLDTNGDPVYSAPPATESQMRRDTDRGHAWKRFTGAEVPSAVCIKDSTARTADLQLVSTFHNVQLRDVVTITQATYTDDASKKLEVQARSSDSSGAAPELELLYYGQDGVTALVNGAVTLTGLAAPPATVTVRSSAGGEATVPVTVLGSGQGAGVVAADRSVTVAEDASVTFDVLTADQISAGATVTLSGETTLRGTLTVDDQSASFSRFTYTPDADFSGSDGFEYTLTDAEGATSTGVVTITVTPVNDQPVAASDAVNAVATQVTQINVLTNDNDPDGTTDLATAELVAGSVQMNGAAAPTGTAVTAGANGVITFTAPSAGSYTFQYRAKDKAGALSEPATVTVIVSPAASETIALTRAEFVTSKGRLRVEGTLSPAQVKPLMIEYLTSAGAAISSPTFSTTTAANGVFAFDQSGVSAPSTAAFVRVRTQNGTQQQLTLTRK